MSVQDQVPAVVRMETIRTVLVITTQLKLQVFQLDVKLTFLNGELQKKVYVKYPCDWRERIQGVQIEKKLYVALSKYLEHGIVKLTTWRGMNFKEAQVRFLFHKRSMWIIVEKV